MLISEHKGQHTGTVVTGFHIGANILFLLLLDEEVQAVNQ
mgnify:CR=1 FL=1